jgi:hypothetical protein
MASEWDPQTVQLCAVQQSVEEEALYHSHPVQGMLSDVVTDVILPSISAIYRQDDSTRYVSHVQVMSEDRPVPRTFESKSRHTNITPADLSNKWLIGLQTAKQTLHATTQRFARSAILPLSRRYRASVPLAYGHHEYAEASFQVEGRQGGSS